MNNILLVTSALLGFLSFFEPCTIATHTLFAVRTSHGSARNKWLALSQLILSRIFFLVVIFGVVSEFGI